MSQINLKIHSLCFVEETRDEKFSLYFLKYEKQCYRIDELFNASTPRLIINPIDLISIYPRRTSSRVIKLIPSGYIGSLVPNETRRADSPHFRDYNRRKLQSLKSKFGGINVVQTFVADRAAGRSRDICAKETKRCFKNDYFKMFFFYI